VPRLRHRRRGDHDADFYLWGPWAARDDRTGHCAGQPKLPVVVITGDGEMLMGMGKSPTVGLQSRQPHDHVLDNEVYAKPAGSASHRGYRPTSSVSLALADHGCPRRIGDHGRYQRPLRTPFSTSQAAALCPFKTISANLDRVLCHPLRSLRVTRIRGALGSADLEVQLARAVPQLGIPKAFAKYS